MKLTEEQLASLSSQKAVNEFLETQRESITNIIKQNLAVGDIFKRENLEVCYICLILLPQRKEQNNNYSNKTLSNHWMQFASDELVKEVENSIAEFKKHKQEYDEERVKDQVSSLVYLSISIFLSYIRWLKRRGSSWIDG